MVKITLAWSNGRSDTDKSKERQVIKTYSTFLSRQIHAIPAYLKVLSAIIHQEVMKFKKQLAACLKFSFEVRVIKGPNPMDIMQVVGNLGKTNYTIFTS